MSILNTVAKMAVKPLPRAISPRAHAIIDYVSVGLFFASAALFWRRNKRAAVAAVISGGAELAVNLLTNYPGGVKKIIHFNAHRDIDSGLGAMTATMPEFLAFKDEKEGRFFLAQGAALTAVSGMTKTPRKEDRAERKYAA